MDNVRDLHAYARALFRRADSTSPLTEKGASTVSLLSSHISSLVPHVPVMVCGLRPGGGRAAADAEWNLTQHIYEPGSEYSSLLDIPWHGSRRGNSSHQIALQAVLAYLAGATIETIAPWLAGDQRPPEERLSPEAVAFVRKTPTLHLNPFRVELTDQEGLAVQELDRRLGWLLVRETRPRLLICDGNGTPSAWSQILDEPDLQVEVGSPAQAIPRSFQVKRARVVDGPLKDMEVIGLPTLSQAKRTHVLRILEILEDWGVRTPPKDVAPGL